MMDDRTVRLVTFGKGGDTVYYSKDCRTTGYGSPENPHAAEGKEIPDGVYAIDKRKAVETDSGFRWVLAGPLVDVDLAEGEVERCPEPSWALKAGTEGNLFGQLLKAQEVAREKKAPRGPLDSVGIQEYVDGWRRHGARIGVYQAGKIVWEGEES